VPVFTVVGGLHLTAFAVLHWTSLKPIPRSPLPASA
jgi:hypothetical protein